MGGIHLALIYGNKVLLYSGINMNHDENINYSKVNCLNVSYFILFTVFVLGFLLSNSQYFGLSRDYENYKTIFSSGGSGVVLEPFYRLLMQVFDTYEDIISIVLVLAMCMKLRFIALYTKHNQALILFILYYISISIWVLDYTQFRNNLCISILIFSVYFLFNKRKFEFYWSIIAAIATHWSAFPFLLLYPYVHNHKIRLLGNIMGGGVILVYISGYAESLILFIRSYDIGQKIGHGSNINFINSLSLTFVAWYVLTFLSLTGKIKQIYSYFFLFAFLQYFVFVIFSLPVLAFRTLEMYFFIMVTIDLFIMRYKVLKLSLLGKLMIIFYLAFYYHVLFGVVNV